MKELYPYLSRLLH
jgi:hypothetical protein